MRMKKFFTLIATTMVVMGLNAQEWRPTETAPEAGTAIVDDEQLEVKTVFATTNNKAEVGPEDAKVPVSYTLSGNTYTFNYFTQIRVDAAPKAGAETGTEKSGSTPWVVTAKKDVDITVYYRRQQVSAACTDNDGKDLKLIEQTKPGTAIAASTFEWTPIEEGNEEYAYALKAYKLEAGKVYTLWARGTTIQCYGFDYKAGSGAEETPLAADGTHIISFDGQSSANMLEYDGKLKGFKLQITGNEEKSISSAKAITIDGSAYTTMKVSNGAQNTLTLPEGKVASAITFYSYVNGSANEEKPSFWKEVAGGEFTAETPGAVFECYESQANPDERTFSFGNGKLNKITFTNTGVQCCYVIKITIETGDEVPVETVVTGIKTIKNTVIDLNAPAYNLAGQKVSNDFKGLVIKNGKKFMVK